MELFEERRPNNKKSNDMGLVPDQELYKPISKSQHYCTIHVFSCVLPTFIYSFNE